MIQTIFSKDIPRDLNTIKHLGRFRMRMLYKEIFNPTVEMDSSFCALEDDKMARVLLEGLLHQQGQSRRFSVKGQIENFLESFNFKNSLKLFDNKALKDEAMVESSFMLWMSMYQQGANVRLDDLLYLLLAKKGLLAVQKEQSKEEVRLRNSKLEEQKREELNTKDREILALKSSIEKELKQNATLIKEMRRLQRSPKKTKKKIKKSSTSVTNQEV